jgi:hypothetical protein
MSDNEACLLKDPTRTPWNKGKLIGAIAAVAELIQSPHQRERTASVARCGRAPWRAVNTGAVNTGSNLNI